MTRLSKGLPKRKMSPTPSHIPVLAISGPCCSHGSRKSSRSSAPVVASRCGSSPSSPRWAPFKATSNISASPQRHPPIASTRGPPHWEEDIDPRKGTNAALNDSLPEYEFDQRVSG